MKKNRIALILLAGAVMLLPSCLKEQFEEEVVPVFNEGEVAFRIGSVSTKSGVEPKAEVLEIATVNVGEGHTLYLQDEVTSLDDAYAAAETKGTPAFTENVAAVHGTFSVVSLLENGNSAFAAPENGAVSFVQMTETPAYWHHRYGQDIWEGKLPTSFFMRMPETQKGVTLAESPYNTGTGSISFSYTSPVSTDGTKDGEAQEDILFSSYKRTETENGEDITFFHALTGVKFANHFDYGTNTGAFGSANTIIKSIKITGLKNQGDCTVTPYVVDNNGQFQSYKANSEAAVSWSNVKGSATFTQTIAYDFANYAADGSKLKDTPLGSATNQASKQNLNDNDGSLTFWFIPQTLSDDVTITIVFDVTLKKNGVLEDKPTFKDMVLTVNLADKLREKNHLTWKPGELHTFTLWPTAVGVEIKDTMAGATKSAVVVRNTGNTWNYVRVNLIANWWGEAPKTASTYTEPTILMGYTSQTGDEEVKAWNDKDTNQYGTNYGKFENLVPLSTTSEPIFLEDNNWVRFDKYYYYSKAIGPNDAITDPLFTSYTVYASPKFWIADLAGVRREARNVHLEMDLMVEAVEAPIDAEGNLIYPDTDDQGQPIPAAQRTGYKIVWAQALGVSVSDLDDLK